MLTKFTKLEFVAISVIRIDHFEIDNDAFDQRQTLLVELFGEHCIEFFLRNEGVTQIDQLLLEGVNRVLNFQKHS